MDPYLKQTFDFQMSDLDACLRKLTPSEEYLKDMEPISQNKYHSKYNKNSYQEFRESYFRNEKNPDHIKFARTIFEIQSNTNHYISTNLDTDLSMNQQTRFISSPAHMHTFIELVYVYDGEFKQYIGASRDEVIMKKGEICILNSNVLHEIAPPGLNDIIINFIMPQDFFDATFLKLISTNDIITEFLIHSLFEEKARSEYLLFPSFGNEKVSKIMELILTENYNGDSYSPVVIKSYFAALFTELLRVYRNNFGTDYPKEIIDKTVRTILEYMKTNLKSASLSEVAKQFHFNPNYLGRMIKQKTNQNFSDILQTERLNKACILLEKSELPVKYISEEIGYQNPNQFFKVFRENFGCTPQEYRKRTQRDPLQQSDKRGSE